MNNDTDILSVYRDKDKKNIHLTQKFFSISPPFKGDGAIQVSEPETLHGSTEHLELYNAGLPFGTDTGQEYENKRKINLYREILRYPEVDNIVNQIVADAIVYDENKRFVHLNLDETNFSESIKDRILEEFDNVLKLYNSKMDAMRHFKKYYVDSKIFFHKVIDPDNPQDGILELRELDPRLLTLHRKSTYRQDHKGNEVWVGYEDFFIYEVPRYRNRMGYDYSLQGSDSGKRVLIPRSAIVYAHSGLLDCNDQIVGHLHQAIKPAHTLKMLEDALVIYRVTRAPDRKIFYVDTGDLPPHKAREFMEKLRRQHTNKTVYDTETGKFDTYKNQLLVTDDYWLQRQNGHSNAEIDVLPGASGMDQIEDIKWHNRKLFEALKVPLSRMPNENVVMFGDDGGTSRDERIFQKFIRQIREYYSEIFRDPLGTNLILKGIITEEEWLENKNSLIFNYNDDEYYTELADLELTARRIEMLSELERFRGKYFSGRYIMKNILKYTDEDIERIRDEIEEESDDELFNPKIRLDQYGRVMSPEEMGTYSTDYEQIIPPEMDPNFQKSIMAGVEGRAEGEEGGEEYHEEDGYDEDSLDEKLVHLNETIKFKIYG